MAKIDTCDCQGCLGLARRYKADPVPLAFYRRQLLLRGWAGATDDVEKGHMAAHATWYRSMRERGAELASQYPQPKRKAVTEEAPTPPDKESGCQHPGPPPLQAQLTLPLGVP